MDSSKYYAFTVLFDNYRSRILLCLTASLVLLLALFRTPVQDPEERVGWAITQHMNEPVLTVIDINQQNLAEQAPPVTYQESERTDLEAEPEPEPDATESEPEESLPDEPPPLDHALRMVYEEAEEMPEVEGGMTNYYLNINYPHAAILAGIQGRLVLTFIVEPSGRATNIRVSEPLHALCDSAAVRALRQTRFVPGKQRGQPVPVRMELPVRFEIVDSPVASSSSDG